MAKKPAPTEVATEAAPAPPEFDMSDPTSSSYAEGARFLRAMFDPSAFITDAGAFVLHHADRTKAGLPADGQTFIERSRALLARAMATLDDPDASEEARRQAIDTAIWAAFQIGDFKGSLYTIRHEQEHGPRERLRDAAAGRATIAAARQEWIRKRCANDKQLLLGKPRGLARRLADELLGSPELAGKLLPASKRGRKHTSLMDMLNRDLKIIFGNFRHYDVASDSTD